MSSITDMKAFSLCYGSDSCDNIKVSQSIVDFIRDKIINTEKSMNNQTTSPKETEKSQK